MNSTRGDGSPKCTEFWIRESSSQQREGLFHERVITVMDVIIQAPSNYEGKIILMNKTSSFNHVHFMFLKCLKGRI